MRWTSNLSTYLAKLVITEWKNNNAVVFKGKEEQIISYINNLLSADINKVKQLEQEVEQMLTQLEITNAGQFERYKMYPLLKKELAKKKGIIL